MQLFIISVILFFSSLYVLLLDYLSPSARDLQKVLVFALIIFVLIAYRSFIVIRKKVNAGGNKWLPILWGTIFAQLLIIATGGLQSPFFILIHITMIGLSLAISFSVSLLFLLFSFAVIFIDMSLHQNLLTLILTKPTTIILQILSLLTIIPISYIVSQQYHLKELFLNLLYKEVQTSEAILKNLNELVVVTDPQLRILSINDAVELALKKSRTELFGKPIFSVILLKDATGELVKNEIFLDLYNQPNQIGKASFMLINAPINNNSVTIKTQIIKDADDKTEQITFIFEFANQKMSLTNENLLALDIARARYEALIKNLKYELYKKELSNFHSELVLIEKIESDIYDSKMLNELTSKRQLSHVDLAQLCKETVMTEQEFAKFLHVSLTFSLINFSDKDIAPLVIKDFPVTPDKFTGPFFTIECDIKQMGLLIKKLIDTSLLLASTVTPNHVSLSVGRIGNDILTVVVKGNCPVLSKQELSDIFLPYYKQLYTKTGLHMGSGFDGFLVKSISDNLNIPVDINYNNAPAPMITFTINIKHK